MSPQRGKEGVQKMALWGDFQGLTGMTRGKRGGQKIGKLGWRNLCMVPNSSGIKQWWAIACQK